jgi:hypothetical protein
MATTGVVGQAWRADVAPWGAVDPWDRSGVLDWRVAADDRWHDPRTEPTLRHRRIDGAAVFETAIRIPGGDAVQRVWSVADAGGYTLVEVTNESTLPIAVVFTRPDVVAHRAPTSMAVPGIDVPSGSVVLPVAHRTTVTVGLPHRGFATTLPDGLPAPDAVARGWVARTDAASRLDLPDAAAVDAVRAARCEALLCALPDPRHEPERYLLTAAELVRIGELAGRGIVSVVDDVALAAEAAGRRSDPLRSAALAAAGVALAAAGEQRALRDLERARVRPPGLAGAPRVDTMAVASVGGDAGIEVVAAVERRIVAGTAPRTAALFPEGIPATWLGRDFEAHGLVAGPASELSLAVRWHGENAAVLWEVSGDAVGLTSPAVPGGWATDATRGESLWVLDGSSLRA